MKTKQTEIGIIPEDWEVVLLNELAIKIGSGITPTGGETVYLTDGRPLVRSQNVGWGKLLLDDVAFISDKIHYTFPNTEIKINDVFLNISGASIGRCSFANEELVGGNVNQHVCIIRTIDKILNPIFLHLFLLSKKGQKQIDSFQSGGNRQGLNIGQIKTFLIPIPPLAEQKRIAEALSDMDALIANLDALIDKKRNLKQAAKQTLLTPKDDWEVKKIKEVASITTGAKNAQDKIENGLYPFFVRSQTIERINSYSFDGEAVLTAGDGVGTGKVFHYINGKFDIHQRVYMISNFDVKLNGYYFFLFFRSFFYERIMQMTAKSSVDSVRKEMIAEMLIPLPPLPEQQSIAQILSDMDSELEGLEGKRAKYKTLKTGMMQELLTGRVRLM